ncbi:hypothetical protein CEXT_233511 [Caerostris extrusa]|uniref:Uncharacterized protein n=1 Tax=Caerostris extrusa TaxID=172846 RepID=A0AAV4TGE0_CAEEX|nr:hypothetical protein CEXT_233511 [Caerostris extrusa]
MFPFSVQETPHFLYGLALEYYYGDRAIILKAMGCGFGVTQSQLESAINEAYRERKEEATLCLTTLLSLSLAFLSPHTEVIEIDVPFYVQEPRTFVYGLALEYYYGDRAIILKAMGRGFGTTQSNSKVQ